MNKLINLDDKLNESMMNGIKIAIESEIKAYIQKDVDVMIEEIAKEIAKRYYVNVLCNYSPLDNASNIRLELLLGTPEKYKKFKAVSTTELVEDNG